MLKHSSFSSFFILILVYVIEIRMECCEIPKIKVTEQYYQKPNPHFKMYDGFYSLEIPDYPEGFYQYGKSGKIIDILREPDANGFSTFESKDPVILLKCTSDDLIDFIYTAEEINVHYISTDIMKSIFQPHYIISSNIIFNNGTGYGKFGCSNACGTATINIQSNSDGFSTFKNTASAEVTLPPSTNEMNNKSGPCSARMEVQIDYINRFMRAKCIHNDNINSDSDLKFKMFKGPIDLYASIKIGILPDRCINHLKPSEVCEQCIPHPEFSFQPTLISCFNSTVKHFVFFPLDSFYQDATATKYHLWSDADLKRMMYISPPPKITSRWFNYIKCKSSSMIFVIDPYLQLGTRFNGSTIWDNLHSLKDPERENYNIVTFYPFGLELSNVSEIKCRARVWNSTQIVEITKLIQYKFAPPEFDKNQEIITYSDNVNLTVKCFASSDLYLTYNWIFSTPNDIPPRIDNTLDDSSINFLPMRPTLAGSYFCAAKNSYGESVKEFILRQAETASSFPVWIVVLGILSSFGVVVALIAFGIQLKKRRMRLQNSSAYTSSLDSLASLALEPFDEQIFKVWNSAQPWLKLSNPDPIGSGSFSVVYKVLNVILKEEFALKRIRINKASQNTLSEIRNLASVNDPHVLRMIHCWIEDETGQLEESHLVETKFEESSPISLFLFMTMELCDFSLQHWLAKECEIIDRIDHIPKLIRDCIWGLSAFHRKEIIHMDIRPSNILCIADSFGNPQIWKLGLSKAVYGMGSKTGSEKYKSPEIQTEGCKYTTKTDVFSLGLTFVEAIHSFHDDLERYKLFETLRECSVFFNYPCQKVCKLINRMLLINPEERIDIMDPDGMEYLSQLK